MLEIWIIYKSIEIKYDNHLLQEKLTEELRDSMKRSRKESELNTVDSQIRGLETRLKYSKTDREKTVSSNLMKC